jgi:hypothetical protein
MRDPRSSELYPARFHPDEHDGVMEHHPCDPNVEVARPACRYSLAGAALGAIVVAICISRNFIISPTAPGLDPSFVYAFNYAARQKLWWGHDFISTYGPYGYLLSTVDIAGLAVRKLSGSFVLVGGAAAAAALYVWREVRLPATVRIALLAVLLYALDIQSPEYQCLGFLVLVLLIGVRSRDRTSVAVFGLAGVLAGLYVLIKFSLGGGAALTVAAGCLLDRRPLQMAFRSGSALCGGIGSLLLAWHAYHGELKGLGTYLTTGLEVSRGYASAMSLAQEPAWLGPGSFVIWFFALAWWVMRERCSRLRLSLAVLAVPLFVAWKHAVVRQDVHVSILILFGMFALTILVVDAAVLGRARRAIPVVAVLLVPLLIPLYSWPGSHRGPSDPAELCRVRTLAGRLVQPFSLCGLRNQWALWHFGEYRDRLARMSRDALKPDALPEPTRLRIGTAPVDVYPWEISYVPANGLSWSNRPLPASFNAYTPRLDALNAAFFSSSRRPEYLLWHTRRRGDAPLESIDGRHLFWDEPKTLRTILDSYDLVESHPGIHLLRVRGRHRFSAIESLGRQTAMWNAWLPVPQAPGIVLIHAVVEPSPVMRAIRTVFREPAVYMSLRFSSGEEAGYRLVPENAGEGLWVSPFPSTVDEFVDLLRNGTGRRVVAVRLSTGRLGPLYAPIAVSWARVVLEDGAWNRLSR